MIRRISRVDNYGIFRDWRWPVDGPALSETTVIYGANGTGKSTLAAVLRDAASGDARESGLVIEVANDAESKPQAVSAADDSSAVWRRVRVFDAHYVGTHLAFDADPVSATPLLTLGRQAVDAADEVKSCRARIASIEESLPRLAEAAAKYKKEREKLAKETASRIVDECGAAGDSFSGRRYKATQVRTALDGDRQALLEGRSSHVGGDLATINQTSLNQLSEPSWPVIGLTDDEREAASLLAKSVASVALEDLRADPAAATWVQDGLALHAERPTCLFCEGSIAQDRRDKLAAHFDRSLTDLQSDLRTLDSKLASCASDLDNALRNLPRSNDLAVSLRERYDAWLSTAEHAVASAKKRIAALRSGVTSKLAQIFDATPMPELPPASSVDKAELLEIVSSHNALSGRAQETRAQAARRVECLRISEIADRYTDLQRKENDARTEHSQLTDERKQLLDKVAGLEQRDRDPRPLANELTKELAQLLGRTELTFQPTGEGGRYAITRNGQPAARLSEGERTAISLLYFLASLRQDSDGAEVNAGQIVVVDDPVSSLDSAVMFGASSHLWRRLHEADTVSQVVILTHDFDLLRTWMQLLDDQGTIAEMRVRTVMGPTGPQRIPTIIGWSDKRNARRRLRSEYHYLFWRVATALADCRAENPSHESEMDAVAVLPNAARKMLEGFFSFHSPANTGNLKKALEANSGRIDGADAQAIMLYLHQQSHGDRIDPGKGVLISTAVSTLTSVFAVMKAIDSKHVKAMCHALDLDPDLL